jgi:phosphomannomutase
MDELRFRGREVPHLAFGTSGLRGLVTDITDLEAYVNARGFLAYCAAQGDVTAGDAVYLSGDLRPSTHRIMSAVAFAIQEAGLRPVDCGPIPTPALMSYAVSQGAASIMVTGSHIPFDRNGIKFNRPTGEVLKSDEAEILQHVARHRAHAYGDDPKTSPFDDDGRLRTEPLPSDYEPAAAQHYHRRYVEFFGPDALAGLTLGWFEHSAVGRDLIRRILESLGAEVIPIGRSEDFVPIDTEAIFDDRIAALQALVDPLHRRLDAVLSTDGDSDRPLLLGVEDGRLRFFGGELLGIVTTAALDVDFAAVPVSCSDVVERALPGLTVVRTRIGSPWVIAAMNQSDARRRVGWEANGGYLLGSPLTAKGRTLAALPTRDAVLPLVSVLADARARGMSVVERFRALPQRATQNGLLDDFPRAAALELVADLSPDGPPGEHDVPAQLAARLARTFSPEAGFGPAQRINTIDGVRITFAGDEVVHLRPSGNAPQLRIYAVAATPDRVAEIVRRLGGPDEGFLRDLLQDVQDRHRLAAALGMVGALEHPEPARILGVVSGSEAARAFWQTTLEEADTGAPVLRSLHEDLPVNQAFGLLLMWHRIRSDWKDHQGALMAFVFGEGTRSTPWTETDNGQKPALSTFVRATAYRSRPMVELALRTFSPVEAFLRRSGFDGVVVKWGDEALVPAVDLSGTDARFAGADVVRFVSMVEVKADDAANKDWVGVASDGRVTAFIPRRPLAEMEPLADQGLLQRRAGRLWGGVNLGSIGISRRLLDALWAEFEPDVLDAGADRKQRPDLDPQFFTALTIAARPDPDDRVAAWAAAQAETPAMAELQARHPRMFDRLRTVLDRFEAEHGRPVSMQALDFGQPYWGDIGQHHRIRSFFMDLLGEGFDAEVARALAGLAADPDADGNRRLRSTVDPRVRVTGSVLIDAHVTGTGEIRDSVVIGSRLHDPTLTAAFDIESVARGLVLAPGAGTYRLVSATPRSLPAGERATTLFLSAEGELYRVREDTNLKDRPATYDVPVFGNPLSFREAHQRMVALDPERLRSWRQAAQAAVRATFGE